MCIKKDIQQIKACLLGQKKAISASELSDYTGISLSYIHKLTSKNKIPFSKPGGKILFFDIDKINQWLLANPNHLAEDVEQEAINYVTNRVRKGVRYDD
ncbi:excisionase family DNA-binding protein [Daejeonella sp.]|uniref:excisionase family DNA-binding protein n=1 Tax=Daejeonella sp. TaxID=2805397 RepID=UPI0030C18E01